MAKRGGEVELYSNLINRAIENIQLKIVGKRKELELILATLFAEGHVVLEGFPGVAKTLIAKCVAATLGLEFKRIQATPDMLPSDMIGVQIFDPKEIKFVFKRGPVFTNILLLDEINRAPPKTQSALLEAMQERQVTVEGTTYRLPQPFLVMATMNPIEIEGTFPLSEAQVDRFLSKIIIGYPSIEETAEMLGRLYTITNLDDLKPVLDRNTVVKLIEITRQVYVDENIRKYIAAIVDATRSHPMVRLGASPRGAIALYTLSKSIALMSGRDYVTPDDVKYVSHAALSHRIILKSEARISRVHPQNVVDDILEKVDVP
ncbi:MAG: MoxR family ATPase [Ignisphaera sp.]|nr:MoxR family ATPase [Ignisphaera sp.]MCX8167426.1 MoxR family ATPase [Ignisphaera sp.]MDW8086085.1 MoxR family ATPase [Ignisphaera sp.]